MQGARRLTREQLVERIQHEPIVVRSDEKIARLPSLYFGLVIGYVLGMLVYAALVTFTGLERWLALVVTFGLVGALCAWLVFASVRSNKGYTLVADKSGLALSRYGRALWSVPWSALEIESYGLGRARLVLPSGQRVPLPAFSVADPHAMREVRRLVKPYEVKRPRSPRRTIVVATVCGVGLVLGGWGVNVSNARIDSALESSDPTLVWPIVLLCASALLTIPGLIGLCFAAAHLEVLAMRQPRSEFGPTVYELWKEHGKPPLPIEMEPGVRYRYLDPKSLKTHRTQVVPLTIIFISLSVLVVTVGFLAPKDVPLAVLIFGFASMPFALLPLLMLRGERADKAVLGDVVWTERGSLFVTRGDRTTEFSLAQAKAKGHDKMRTAESFMSWHEVFVSAEGSYRLDRRYLWPVE